MLQTISERTSVKFHNDISYYRNEDQMLHNLNAVQLCARYHTPSLGAIISVMNRFKKDKREILQVLMEDDENHFKRTDYGKLTTFSLIPDQITAFKPDNSLINPLLWIPFVMLSLSEKPNITSPFLVL